MHQELQNRPTIHTPLARQQQAAAFNYSAASRAFSPGTTADVPPQGNDAKCGLGCHTIVKTRDYVFTDYQSR